MKVWNTKDFLWGGNSQTTVSLLCGHYVVVSCVWHPFRLHNFSRNILSIISEKKNLWDSSTSPSQIIIGLHRASSHFILGLANTFYHLISHNMAWCMWQHTHLALRTQPKTLATLTAGSVLHGLAKQLGHGGAVWFLKKGKFSKYIEKIGDVCISSPLSQIN